MIRTFLRTQAICYLITGMWPIFHIESFEWVTGPKTDIWLVKMVGMLSIAVSVSMLTQLAQKQQSLTLSVSTAMSFFIIDVYYVMTGTISNIYLADAVAELIFLVLACVASIRKKEFRGV